MLVSVVRISVSDALSRTLVRRRSRWGEVGTQGVWTTTGIGKLDAYQTL